MVSVIQEKSWGLSFLMEMLTEALELNDDFQVKKIAHRGIREAERQNELQWKARFQEILKEYSQDKYSKDTSFDSSEEEENEIKSVDTLLGIPDLSQVKGIGTSVDARLRSNGFTTIEMLASSTPEQLARVPGIGESSARKIIANARTHLENSSNVPFKAESETNLTNEVTPYQKLLTRAKETAKDESEEESDEKFEEAFEEEREYKPIRPSLLSSREKFIEEEVSEDLMENLSPKPYESRVFQEPEPFQVDSIVLTDEVKAPNVSEPKSPKVARSFKVPYREARINSLPNGNQLFQRQQSAQKILRIIREAGMIEIPMNKPELQNVFQAVDLLACKPMRGENGRCIILLVPIKHVSTMEPVYVWDSHVMTGTLDDEPTTSANMAINTHVKKLVNASEYLFSEITNGKSLISLVSRFIGISIKADFTFRNKRLYIGGKEIEFQVILDPVLLTDTEVYCLEKTLPYAYQQGSNLHVASFEQFDEVLEFLQLKYRLLNHHDTSQNAIMKTDEVKTVTYKQLQLFSLPFLAYGLLFSSFLLLGIQEAITFCTSLGYGLIYVYCGLMGFLMVRHFKSMKRIESDFSVPYHLRNIRLSQEDFILINEQLSPDWMVQFSHEIEGTSRRELKHIKAQTPFVDDNVNIPRSSNQDSLSHKYQSFLDD